MLGHKLNYKKSGVPILSKLKLDTIAEDFIIDYNPEALREPRAIDIDDFAFNYRGLNQDFQHLSHDKSILGAMAFQDSYLPIYVPEDHSVRYLKVQGGTIIVDTSLAESNQENRYRYTVSHESSHHILHKNFFKITNDREKRLKKNIHVPHYEDYIVHGSYKPFKQWTCIDWVEWQANYFAAALLMPKAMVYELIRNHSLRNRNFKDCEYVHIVSQTFQVSWEAAAHRLTSLRVISDVNKVKDLKSIYLDFVVGLERKIFMI